MGSTGSHGGNESFVIDSLDELLDKFLVAYLKANAERLAPTVALPVLAQGADHQLEPDDSGPVSDKELIEPTGLEVNQPQAVQLVVERLGTRAADIGLTKELIETMVEARLPQSGLKLDRARDEWDYLYVQVSLFDRWPGDGLPDPAKNRGAFHTSLEFRRFVVFMFGNQHPTMFATTWSTDAVGSYGEGTEDVIGVLRAQLDLFLVDYLKANAERLK
jgi:hypothetical protein